MTTLLIFTCRYEEFKPLYFLMKNIKKFSPKLLWKFFIIRRKLSLAQLQKLLIFYDWLSEYCANYYYFLMYIYLFYLEANYFTILYWFCHTSTWIHHRCTRVPHPEPPPTSLPLSSLWVIPVHQPRASCIMHWTWTGDSFHIWYYICFSAILPNHPTFALSHRVQNTVLFICVSFAVSHTGLSLPSF